MFTILLALHLLFAVFAIGPLAHAVTTATRGLRRADAAATAYSARMARNYGYASVLVVIFGFALMSSKRHGKTVAEFDETWIWLSLLLWVIAMAAVFGLIAPGLDRATARLNAGEPAAALTGRLAATGGLVGLLLAAIVFLMVYQPGK